MSELPPTTPEYDPTDPLRPLFTDLANYIKTNGTPHEERHTETVWYRQPDGTVTGTQQETVHTYYHLPAPKKLVEEMAKKYGGLPLHEH